MSDLWRGRAALRWRTEFATALVFLGVAIGFTTLPLHAGAATYNVPPDPAPLGIFGSTLNLFDGGVLGDNVTAGGSTVNMEGGVIGEYFAFYESTIHVRGGTIGDGLTMGVTLPPFSQLPELHLYGADFVKDGVPLSFSGSTNVPFTATTTLAGTLMDGTPIVLSKLDKRNGVSTLSIPFDTVYVHSALVPPPGDTVIVGPGDVAPHGGSVGVRTGGFVGDHFTALDDLVVVFGGSIGKNLESYRSIVAITDGSVDDDFDAFAGSIVNMGGGTLGNNAQIINSSLNIDGGLVRGRMVLEGSSDANIQGGTIEALSLIKSQAKMTGGNIGELLIDQGASFEISGGQVTGIISIVGASTVHLLATEFLLDGMPISELVNPGDSLVLAARGGELLSAHFLDGSTIDFGLNYLTGGPDSVSPEATVRLTLVAVPEPHAMLLLAAGALIAVVARCSGVN